jgi:hypothetical protein
LLWFKTMRSAVTASGLSAKSAHAVQSALTALVI